MQKISRHSIQEETTRRSRLVIQTLIILLIPLGLSTVGPMAFGLRPPQPGAGTTPTLLGIPQPMIIAAIFVSALIILVRLGQPSISAILLIGAWTLLTTLVALRFGVTSMFPALMLMPICAAGLLIDWVASLSLAGVSTLLVAGSAWISQGSTSSSLPTTLQIAGMEPIISALFWISLYWTVAAMTSLLAGDLQRALRQSRAQAEELRLLSEQLESRVSAQTEQILGQERETATLAERSRLAREIHDGIAQGLTGIVVQLGAARRAAESGTVAAGDHLDLAERMAREALAEARRSVWNMRASALERGDLGDALRGLVERQGQLGLGGSFALDGEPRPLPPDVESALLRVAQESLANVIKHAGAGRVAVDLAFCPGRVRLTVRDDGRGFSDDVLGGAGQIGPWGGFGLSGMRERLAALGGSLELRNQGGAVVMAWAPTPES
ncbi:sensor histidine kinase [Oscillochloris sp. ZM17-4]|uniref:sensor histidine kinase n=1 Tax=Oscillochloris sp. ZM17-4 TaxID=2866714 RepID=UPI001C72D5AF|nr:sensor histidine kinase [Oscillochloris sp. ZM17-4]MBX0327191.1 sensor histidine kinase [Oscillochloris sp. ZM17-4]